MFFVGTIFSTFETLYFLKHATNFDKLTFIVRALKGFRDLKSIELCSFPHLLTCKELELHSWKPRNFGTHCTHKIQ